MNSVNSSDSSNVYSRDILNNIEKDTNINKYGKSSAERKVYMAILNYLHNEVNQSNSLTETVENLNHIIDRSTGLGFSKLNKTMSETFKQAVSKVKDKQPEKPTEDNDTGSAGSQNSLSAEESEILSTIEQSYIDFPQNEGKRTIYYMEEFINKLEGKRGNKVEFERMKTDVNDKLEAAKKGEVKFVHLFVAIPRLEKLMQLSTPDSMHEASWLLEAIEKRINEYLNQDPELSAMSNSAAKEKLQKLQELLQPILEMARPKTSE